MSSSDDEPKASKSKPSQRNLDVDGDDSFHNDDDLVVVEKPQSDGHQIEDKPLTIDMTPNAASSAGGSGGAAHATHPTHSTDAGDAAGDAGDDAGDAGAQDPEEAEQQGLLGTDLHEGQPTTVRGEKGGKKRQRKLSWTRGSGHNAEQQEQQARETSPRSPRSPKSPKSPKVLLHSVASSSKQGDSQAMAAEIMDARGERNKSLDDVDLGGSSGPTPAGEPEEDENLRHKVVENQGSCAERTQRLCNRLYETGALLAILFSVILWGLLVWLIADANATSVILFCVWYVVYVIECYASKTYRYICEAEMADTVSVKVLDALKENAPVIHWQVECYHFETRYSLPDEEKNIILWLYGKESDAHVLQTAGYRVECFQSEWTVVNTLSDPMRFPRIAAIILPSGGIGGSGFTQLQRSITKEWERKRAEHNNVTVNPDSQVNQRRGSAISSEAASDLPVFIKWHEKKMERMQQLISDCVRSGILQKDRREVVTNTNEDRYKFNQWNDISDPLPQWRNSLTNLTIQKEYVLGDQETRMDYDAKKAEFLNRRESRSDERQREKENLKIHGYRKHMLVKLGNSDNTGVPWWMTKTGFWVTSVLMLTIIPRIKVYGMEELTWKLIKQVSIKSDSNGTQE